ncbi:LysR family transcriptional regulator, partial [Rhizobium johnstonii]
MFQISNNGATQTADLKPMDQLSAMRVLIRVVETGNFTRAADM